MQITPLVTPAWGDAEPETVLLCAIVERAVRDAAGHVDGAAPASRPRIQAEAREFLAETASWGDLFDGLTTRPITPDRTAKAVERRQHQRWTP